jgi:hypothetical protein
MKVKSKIWLTGLSLVIAVAGIFWFGPSDQKIVHGMIIATEVPYEVDLINDNLGIDGRYIPGSRIVALDSEPGDSHEPLVLTDGFYSARSPEVSYSGDQLVFSGQKSEGDAWQVYTLDLRSFELFQVTQGKDYCTDPAWLPDGRIAYSMLVDAGFIRPIHVLYACKPDGSDEKRLTFHPNSSFSASVFADGRILIQSEQRYPENGTRQMLALRTDGTKSELFFKNDLDAIPVSRAWEALDGYVYFIEKGQNGSGSGHLASVAQGYPMSSYNKILYNLETDFHSLYPMIDGDLMIASRESAEQPFCLSIFNIEDSSTTDQIFSYYGWHLIEPVIVEVRPVPLQLPTIVDETKNKGTLLCLDVDLSMDDPVNIKHGKKETEVIRIFGLNEMLGEIPVEEDGSFYIEIDADTPVRFQTVNAQGELLRGHSAWIWVRPNEKRSCIGCHEDHELAPENKVPDALYAGLVSLPEGKRTQAIVLNEKRFE